jgi:hypothetical protein
MTKNGMAALIEAVRRRRFEAIGRAPEPAPEPPPTPEPPGLSDLPPAVREAARPFFERFEVRRITLLPVDAPEPEPPYGRGEAGHQTWLMRCLVAQAAEYYRQRDSGAMPAEPSEPKRRAVAATPAGRVEIRRDGASRWQLFVGEPPTRIPEFATPFFDHGCREAETRFGRPKGGWRFD